MSDNQKKWAIAAGTVLLVSAMFVAVAEGIVQSYECQFESTNKGMTSEQWLEHVSNCSP